MAYDGAGTYSLPVNSFNPAVAATDISPTDWNSTSADLATALSTAICKDGQTVTTQSIPFAAGASFAGSGVTVTGSSVPGNGIYLPASNRVGVAASTTNVANFTLAGLWVGATANISGMDNSGGQVLASRGFFTGATCGLVWNSATFITGTAGTSIDAKVYANGVSLLTNAAAWSATSDYRAKNVYGAYQDSGRLIDAIPVHLAEYKNKTQSPRAMFLAHEVAEGGAPFAVHGEKDGVSADGDPIMQVLESTDPLVPILWAEVKALRSRLAAAGI